VVRRTAFTLIELIFAIVIIAITVFSLPMMTQITSNNIEDSLVQEAIFAAAAQLNEATSYRWDEHSMNDKLTATFDPSYSRVINTTTGGCVAGTPNRRPGHVHRLCLNDLTTSPFYSTGTVFSDSLDEAAHGAESIFIGTEGTSAAGYKTLYNSTIVINNNASFQVANDPNIKEVLVTITNANTNDVVTKLRAYSTNIGEVKYASKVY
jgi:prepilin-type N-terminal cleavage/methylation domain-containing protein